MRILFLGDVVGVSGCSKLMNSLLTEIKLKKIDFVIVNGENAASQGVGLTKEICQDFFNCGVDVITTGKSSLECSKLVTKLNSEIVGYACLIDRTNGKSKIKNKIISQVEISIPTFNKNDLPEHLKSIPAIKPGSRNLNEKN